VVSQKTATSWAARLPVSPAVLWTGIALGVFLAVEALVHGVVLPLSLGLLTDAALTFLLILALAVVAAELTRRHHRTVLSHGGRLSAAGARHVQRHGGSALAWLAAKAGARWANREHWPLTFRWHSREPGSEAGDPGPEAPVAAPPAPNLLQPSPSTEGKPMALNQPGRHAGPGFPDHTFAECSPELCGKQRGELARKYPSRIAPERRAQRAAARTGGTVPSEWGRVIAQTADFEPENDGELLDWMGRQVTGLSAWAEALVDTYEHCTAVIGIDPQASAMRHDVADAAAQAAETMSAAKAKFTQHYELPREFAANGGLMTHDGRWITGEGA
jgi:hypothetical protein